MPSIVNTSYPAAPDQQQQQPRAGFPLHSSLTEEPTTINSYNNNNEYICELKGLGPCLFTTISINAGPLGLNVTYLNNKHDDINLILINNISNINSPFCTKFQEGYRYIHSINQKRLTSLDDLRDSSSCPVRVIRIIKPLDWDRHVHMMVSAGCSPPVVSNNNTSQQHTQPSFEMMEVEVFEQQPSSETMMEHFQANKTAAATDSADVPLLDDTRTRKVHFDDSNKVALYNRITQRIKNEVPHTTSINNICNEEGIPYDLEHRMAVWKVAAVPAINPKLGGGSNNNDNDNMKLLKLGFDDMEEEGVEDVAATKNMGKKKAVRCRHRIEKSELVNTVNKVHGAFLYADVKNKDMKISQKNLDIQRKDAEISRKDLDIKNKGLKIVQLRASTYLDIKHKDIEISHKNMEIKSKDTVIDQLGARKDAEIAAAVKDKDTVI